MFLQIFQWLASMPVELEGYIRPGCTILTIFIAMPNIMWINVRVQLDVLFIIVLVPYLKCPLGKMNAFLLHRLSALY